MFTGTHIRNGSVDGDGSGSETTQHLAEPQSVVVAAKVLWGSLKCRAGEQRLTEGTHTSVMDNFILQIKEFTFTTVQLSAHIKQFCQKYKPNKKTKQRKNTLAFSSNSSFS